jgi:hypothetical protein
MDLERFQAKWIPVRVKKTRQNKTLESSRFSIGTGKTLAASNTASCGRETPLTALEGPFRLAYIRTLNGENRMTDTANADASGAVTGGLRTLLRLEGLALFLGMTLLYGLWDGSWWVYAALFLAPDLSFAAYLWGPRTGAAVYNAAHSYMGPMALMTTGFTAGSPIVLSLAIIWLAHIGFDRALGYGLKYAAGFGFTHLGRIGKA